MPEALAEALATPGFLWIVAATFVAGAVYGFAGFGAALVFMPVATVFLAPAAAIATLGLIAIASILTLVPPAWRQADKRATLGMIGTALVTMPLGVAVLRVADPTLLRWGVTGLASVCLGALLLGWRRTGPDTVAARAAIAGASGFFGGSVGLNGPILVLFHLSGRMPVAVSRANTIVFLSMTGLAVLPFLALQGLLDGAAIALGLLLCLPYALGGLFGQALFRPGQEQLYRNVAYTIIGAAILIGLPVWV
ncbi:MAG: sulfite exporter TauE/SafE family protein [Pseudomonadota bacterium]